MCVGRHPIRTCSNARRGRWQLSCYRKRVLSSWLAEFQPKRLQGAQVLVRGYPQADRRGATLSPNQNIFSHPMFQSTLPVGGATSFLVLNFSIDNVSIHAPRGGSDDNGHPKTSPVHPFQSTLPVGGATRLRLAIITPQEFQSTLPVGGATDNSVWTVSNSDGFNPRSPWGERLSAG